LLSIFFVYADSEGPTGNEEEKSQQADAKTKLADLKQRFGRDDGTFDLEDLGDELDHLDEESDDDDNDDNDDDDESECDDEINSNG
jgi:hypothetical protein